MSKPINVLFVEDTVNDCTLLVEYLRENGYQPEHRQVETGPAMLSALNASQFDVILCDHNLPNFDVLSALEIAKNHSPNTPFIVVSGTVSETVAVSTLTAGAKDYVLKGNLSRLAPAIKRELVEAQNRAARQKVEIELENKESELRQAQKLEAVGQLAGGVAHDFNNVLAVILLQAAGAIEAIEENPALKASGAEIYKSLEQIIKSGTRAANLTRQLLAFSRKQVIQPTVLGVNETCLEMEQMLSRLIEENIKLTFELDPQVKNIKIDLGQFEQILMNLAANARDAMPDGGQITISTQNVHLDEAQAAKISLSAGPYVLLAVADTGCGMSEDIQKNMFNPFFTTKELGRGTGLGLSTVYGIVKQNHGEILVKSHLNKGSEFKLYFPQCDEKAIAPAPENADAYVQNESETILVAEDDANLRETICRLLGNNGYDVLEAQDGVEALEFIRLHENAINLVISDIVMPNLGGRMLEEKARNLDFKGKFLFLSGYTEDTLLRKGGSTPNNSFLEKPFLPKEILNRVRILLSGASSGANGK